MKREDFQELIRAKGAELWRDMPWRDDTRPYFILVSELMLQQTQVDRVIPKFLAFIERFPNETLLATSPLADVLMLWNGLGYNRRAKYLHDAAKKIQVDYKGSFPRTYEELLTLPGVGPGTAGAIMTYAYNQPVPYIETNVRTVYFHHFFQQGEVVTDIELQKIVSETISTESPRDFYWALMDYGAFLKRSGLGRVQQSRHYKKQSPLKGSVREVRGMIIRQLSDGFTESEALRQAMPNDSRFEHALTGLLKDGLISQKNGQYHLTK